MKILIYALIVFALGLIIYNFTFLDFNNLLGGESKTALVGIVASSIVVVLMLILLVSKAIAKKANNS